MKKYTSVKKIKINAPTIIEIYLKKENGHKWTDKNLILILIYTIFTFPKKLPLKLFILLKLFLHNITYVSVYIKEIFKCYHIFYIHVFIISMNLPYSELIRFMLRSSDLRALLTSNFLAQFPAFSKTESLKKVMCHLNCDLES